MPINYKNYPANWKEIRARILERAGHKCEQCYVPNHAWIIRDNESTVSFVNKRFLQMEGYIKPPFILPLPCGDGTTVDRKVIMIVLTVAHLDHDLAHNTDDNLKALCQRCHLRYDAKHHAANARKTRTANVEQMELAL